MTFNIGAIMTLCAFLALGEAVRTWKRDQDHVRGELDKLYNKGDYGRVNDDDDM